WGLGTLVSLGILALPAAGKHVFVIWMLAAVPIGWSISHAVLALAYYLAVTPIGLAMRLFGYDPMKRRFDAAASSYWDSREPEADRSRYLRQF
ncbi:MAG: SxtJ family membrane protein, partial [Pirellulaceae bacterium]|nr:SxtJ family membrane protein [Pirellulaceae bacterium]